ncbi:NUDIX hydrolase [Geobacillus sp. G4]|uniref:ADP-ribose pyrophosphatase n=4 Tax=Geobacillus TaxID=129337 RepID=A0A7U9JCX9_GEOTM|nr:MULTISPECIES: NUDIX hydrolase [Geobacillus]AEV19920.1 ADP-ribose pyrophosphatase [Geobacillus thermoleovorans CCB_US3_UF5]AOL35066.1 ADP-ribose pyrophosphatase [Geobacillus thermoleovorans]AWO75537.1 NUDIX hydrolase [Geobacillus thermoleovorans]ESU73223.1 ADP-ribose pyrophosphatase [Geobacillus sp. MAS1]MBW7643313.1 NUDIX hydrolase [Geobacillus thermoleovorans]
MEKLYEKTVRKEKLFSGRIIDLYIEEVELPNGKTSQREVIKHPGAVAVLPLLPDGKIVLVRQYRKALERALVEIPAGKLEHGEEPLASAHRELEEETGYRAQSMRHLISFYTSPGFADELIHLYVAEGLEKAEDGAGLDEDEFVELLEVTLEEALEMLQQRDIYDAKTAYALQYLQLRRALGEQNAE